MSPRQIPELRRVGSATQLLVDGKPFLVLGGELGNSTASSFDALANALAHCRSLNLNTMLLPVYWDLIERVEGEFDFTLVQQAIELARTLNLRLVYLWFGTWKNGMSCYAPSWVKRDSKRFSRVLRRDGRVEETISPQSVQACEADARAFAALMRWTKQYDATRQTVIMAQVENEVGMIPEARDHSALAAAAFGEEIPEQLQKCLLKGELGDEIDAIWKRAGAKTHGTWGDVFGTDPQGEEIFSAWSIAHFVEQVAYAGKREYPLPMFANAALIRPGYLPGQYPSAGPLPHLMEVWKVAAPSLEMICPDIYFPNFMEWCERYDRGSNPVFIPEMAASLRAPANIAYAVAQHRAIGCAPFAIEDVDGDKAASLTQLHEILAAFSDEILAAQREGRILGLSPQIGFDWSVPSDTQVGELGGVRFCATFDRPSTGGDSQSTALPTIGVGRWDAPAGTPLGSVIVIDLGNETFLLIGRGVRVTFEAADGKHMVGIDRAQEVLLAPAPVDGRWLNGDQTHQGRHIHLYDGRWSVQRVTVYRY